MGIDVAELERLERFVTNSPTLNRLIEENIKLKRELQILTRRLVGAELKLALRDALKTN